MPKIIPAMLILSSPAAALSSVGKQVAAQLKHLGVQTVQDLLFYFPFRYEDWSRIVSIKDLQPGQTATVRGRLELIRNRRSRWKKMLLTEAVIADNSGSMTVGWFHQPYLARVLKIGEEIYLSGKVDDGRAGEWQMINPIYEKISASGKNIHTARIVPIYNTTARLSQKQIRFLIKQAMTAAQYLQEWLPREIQSLMPLKEAISEIHFSSSLAKAEEARRRFKFEELFLFQLLAQMLRRDLDQSPAPGIRFDENLTREFVSSLPFKLTQDQRRTAWDIIQDIGKSHPMNRLLEGEVGSGKTVVAAVAILNAVKSGYQVAYMAPTEILARQHFETLSKFLEPFGISVGLLTNSYQTSNLKPQISNLKSQITKQILNSEIQLVIGTHALIQEKVKFKNLGMAIIDEQHRFGVEQRKLLREKSRIVPKLQCSLGTTQNKERLMPHLLSMTATPIPRTLSLAFYGDLDLSFIKELPKERKRVITYLVNGKTLRPPLKPKGGEERVMNAWTREQVYNFIRQEIKNNHRVFVLCPLIDPSDKLGCRSVKEEYENLRKNIFPDFEIGILHGRLKSKEKEELMEDFKSGKKPILITTTVVEVGVDVPKATVMMIEGADRFGLSQLHQLRGRVGRGEAQAYCFLMVDEPTDNAFNRLQAFLDCDDGFALAERDLQLRGPGEIWGTSQSGFPEFKIASVKDVDILQEAREAAREIIKKDPDFQSHPLLKGKILEFIKMIKAG